MFAPLLNARPADLGGPRGAARGHFEGRQRVGAILRLTLLVLPLAAAPPDMASAQALGTMQATAQVVPGGPAWGGVRETQDLAERAVRSAFSGSEVRRAGLVQARAEVAAAAGRRRLLITVDYPRN